MLSLLAVFIEKIRASCVQKVVGNLGDNEGFCLTPWSSHWLSAVVLDPLTQGVVQSSVFWATCEGKILELCMSLWRAPNPYTDPPRNVSVIFSTLPL